MNAKTQNISRILKMTKHFIKETNFNKSISKNNETFYNDQLYNLIPKKTPKELNMNINKKKNLNRSVNNIIDYSSPSHQFNKSTVNRTLSLPMLSSCISPSDTIKTKTSTHNATKQKKTIRKVFLLSYNSLIPRTKSVPRNMNNSSVRIINDLLLSVRDDTEYQNLQYEDAFIFYDETQYIRRINDSLHKIIEFYNSYEASFKNLSGYSISKTINAKTENEVNLNLSSVIIKITHSTNTNIHNEFKIPLFLVPAFIYNPFHNLPVLLLSIIYFKNKCTSISCELKEKFLLVITSMYNKLKENYHKDNDKNKNYHEYIYTWITPIDSYLIEIKMPLLTVTFKKTQTIIHKYIDHKLFLYLHDNNFIHWTFYVVHYLYSFKNFRNVVDTISSKISSSHTKYAGKDFIISEERIKMNEKDDIKLLYFLTSEECENYLLIIHSMLLEITLTNQFYKLNKRDCDGKTNSKKINRILRDSISNCRKFDFSFRELKPILMSSLKTNVLDFLSKFITFNPFIKQIGFQYKDLNSFPIHMLDHLPTKQNTNQENIKLFPNYIAKVIYPVLSIKTLDEFGKLNCTFKGIHGEEIHFKDFEMNYEAIQIFLENGNTVASADLVRKLLFYLEENSNKNDILNTDENNRRQFGRRLSTLRRRTKSRISISLSNYLYLGES